VIFVKTGFKYETLRSGMKLPTPFQCPFCSFKKYVVSLIKEFEETAFCHTNTKIFTNIKQERVFTLVIYLYSFIQNTSIHMLSFCILRSQDLRHLRTADLHISE